MAYKDNKKKWEPISAIEAPGFFRCSGNNNMYNEKCAEYLQYMLMNNPIVEKNERVVLSDAICCRIDDTMKYFKQYKKFIASETLSMVSVARSTNQIGNVEKHVLKILRHGGVIEEALTMFKKVPPLGLIYLSILGALIKEYCSNYDELKRNTSGYKHNKLCKTQLE